MTATPQIDTQSRPATPSATGRLPGLEALRCVAAACVLLLHTRATYGGTPVFGRGYLGVDFFLMLSGFLMARVQEPRLAAGMGGWRFLLTRYRRLWPMMALGGLIGLPMQYARAHGLADFARVSALNLAMLPALGQYFAFPLNIPEWTIFADLVVSVVHVLVLRHIRGKWLWLALAGLVPVMVWMAHHYGSLDLGAKPQTLAAGLVRCLFAYMIGMALARWWGGERDAPHAVPPLPPLFAFVAMPLTVAGSWALGLKGPVPDLVFVVAICPLMMAGGLRLRRFEAIARFAGKLAFPLFAWQIPILQGLQHLGCGYWTGMAGAIVGGIAGLFVEDYLARSGISVRRRIKIAAANA